MEFRRSICNATLTNFAIASIAVSGLAKLLIACCWPVHGQAQLPMLG
jgi:hypothetical protein